MDGWPLLAGILSFTMAEVPMGHGNLTTRGALTVAATAWRVITSRNVGWKYGSPKAAAEKKNPASQAGR